MPDVGSGKQGRAHTGLDIPGPLSLYRGDARTMGAAVPSSLRASEGTLQTTGLRGSREPLDFVSRAGGGEVGGPRDVLPVPRGHPLRGHAGVPAPGARPVRGLRTHRSHPAPFGSFPLL